MGVVPQVTLLHTNNGNQLISKIWGGRGEKGGEGEEHMGRSGVVSPQYWLGQPLLLMLANTSRKTTSAAKQHQLPAVRATEGIPRRGSVRT